jgi:hypothetical protein
MHDLLVAALTWDPQIRGALILIAAVLILPGSVYLLLATNTGAKLGLVLAIAGLSGWTFVMAIIWAVYGIGLKGRQPHWEVREVVVEDVRRSATEALEQFPRGWESLPAGNAIRADAQAAADTALVGGDEADHGGGGGGEAEAPRFTSPFKETTDYVTVGAFRKGGDNELFTIGKHDVFFRHSPHYAVLQLKPALDQEGGAGGAPPTPVPDPDEPTYSVVMVRDLGSLRFPPVVVAISFGLIFAICCYWLHQRDKQIWAAKAAGEPTPATA